MSVFEIKREDKLVVDDTKPLRCNIKDAQNTDGHIEYSLEVFRAPDTETRWIVSHRYSDFAQLHSVLKVCTVLPSLPPKKVFGNTDRDFINERKAALQKYIDKILSDELLAGSLPVRQFLDPKNYSRNFQEEGRQNLQIVLRSGGSHEVTEPLPSIGTRLCKSYFLGNSLRDTKTHHLLWWAPFGPDRATNLRDTHATLTALLQCQHPYIIPAISSVATEAGVCVIRPWFSQGTVRDMIHQAKPRSPSLVKYSSDKHTHMSQKEVAVYGRQVLEALLFLNEKGLGHGHLHTGNLVIDKHVCRLVDLENQVVGLPNALRDHMTYHKKINSMEALDVYCFGHVLYEMMFLKRLSTNTCDEYPADCPPLPRSVLESILSTEACKNGLPSVAGLLTHPFFNEIPLHSYEKPSLRLPSSVKQAIASMHETTFTRLATDQKKIRQQRKLSKAEAFVSQHSIKSRSKKSVHETNGICSSETTSVSGSSGQSSNKISTNPAPVPPTPTSTPSFITPTPPPPPPPPPPSASVPPVPPPLDLPGEPSSDIPNSKDPGKERAALLSSITSFKKKNLKKAESNDRSMPHM